MYNPDAPAAIYYGDGTVVLKKDAYSYQSGKLPEGGLDETLKTISDQGFFQMKSKYDGHPDARRQNERTQGQPDGKVLRGHSRERGRRPRVGTQ